MTARRLWVLSLALAVVLAACGDDDADETTDADQATTTTASAPATTVAEATTTTVESTSTAADSSAGDDGDVLTLRAGVNDPEDPNIAVLEYLPESITVGVGQPVRWELAGPEPHSVTFLPAGETPTVPGTVEAEALQAPTPPTGPIDATTLVNSGLAPLGPEPAEFEVTFGAAGDYSYYCVIHAGMTGTVTVVDDPADAEAQEDVTARGDEELAEFLEEGRAAKAELVAAPTRSDENGDGTKTVYVEMGTTTEHTDVLAFAPVQAEIEAGDAVVFVNNSMAPHTASFGGGVGLPADLFSEESLNPAPGVSPQTLDATGYFNTGWLPPNVGPPEELRSFRFDVPEAGTYSYVCLLHAPSAMVGEIVAS